MVLRVVRQRQAEYQACYNAALGWHPGLKGRLVIRFTVEPDGQVSAAAEQSDPSNKFPDEVMATCVAEQFRALTFPAGPATFHVTYPMVFTADTKPER